MKSAAWLCVLLLPVTTFAQSTAPQTPYEKSCEELAAKKFGSGGEKLKAIFDLQWNYVLETYPEAATYIGDSRNQDKLTDMSRASMDLREREEKCSLKMINSVDRAKLSPADQLNFDLFKHQAERSAQGQEFAGEYLLISSMGGIHGDIADLMNSMRKGALADYQNRVARLKAAPKVIGQHVDLLAEGLAKGVTPPKVTIEKIPAQFDPLLVKDMAKNPLFESFREMPSGIAEADKKKIQDEARTVIETEVIPALARYKEFLVKKYVPGARQTLALTALPNGEKWYAFAVEEHTTTKLSPKEIHELGLRETARLDKEMEEAMKAVGWKKDRASFFKYLRTDAKFFSKSREAHLAEFRDIAKRVDPELIRFFGKLPSVPYGIKAIPQFSEREAPTAYYSSGSLEGGRPGWFFANTYDLKARPRWEMEALVLHETVPGHHLQISVAQELEGLPEFRKRGGFTAYVEGWGLYAESLGKDLGLYKDPYSNIGRISMEMWRANRLVVDTGLHALGWSRKQAIDFMLAHTPKSVHDVTAEVDRYIVTPGQALSYKIGQLKFLELRERAKARLGDKFDIRAFHDALLKDGALPLEILEARMNSWIESQAGAK